MTILTIEDLRALPDGTSICVGGTTVERTASTWTKSGDGFTLATDESVRILPEAFRADVESRRVLRAEGLLPEPGQYRVSGSRRYIVLDRATQEEGAGWWVMRVNRNGGFDSLTSPAEPGGETQQESPDWLSLATSYGMQVLTERRATQSALRTRDAAQRRVAGLEHERDVARSEAMEQVRTALEGVGQHVPIDSPILPRLAGLGIPVDGLMTVTLRVHGSSSKTVPIVEDMLPEGTVAREEEATVSVPWQRDFEQQVTGRMGHCACMRYDRGRLVTQVNEALGEEVDFTVAGSHCPYGAHHTFTPEGFTPPEQPDITQPEIGAALTHEQIKNLPYGTTISIAGHRQNPSYRYTRELRINAASTSEREREWRCGNGGQVRAVDFGGVGGGTTGWIVVSYPARPAEAAANPSGLSVGDAIETEEQMHALPIGTTATNHSGSGTLWTKHADQNWTYQEGAHGNLDLAGYLGENWVVTSLPPTPTRDPMTDPQPGDWFSWGSRQAWFRIARVEQDQFVPDGQVSAEGDGSIVTDRSPRRRDQVNRIVLAPDSPDLPDGVKTFLSR